MPPLAYQVSVLNARFIVDAAVRGGVDRAELLQAVCLRSQDLADDHERIGYDRVSALWNEAARLSGDEAFGLHLAERLAPSSFGPVGLAVRSSGTAREAMERLLAYARVAFADTELTLVQEGAIARFSHRYRGTDALATRHAPDLILATFVVRGRGFIGLDWKPRVVTFRAPAPANADEYHRVFGSPVRFEQPINSVVFDASLLDMPMAHGDAEVLSVMDEYAEQFLEVLSPECSLSESVRRAIASALPPGDPRLKSTAARLGLSPRTLQRRLRREHTSHREILDRVRRERALRLLRRDELSVEQIAEQLGFSEPSAFHRAFRRWTGRTPADRRPGSSASSEPPETREQRGT